MNYSDSPAAQPSPRRELQGPRPTPLKVCKDSFKIKKPPAAPPQSQPAAQPPHPRPPVIIYTVSPKVIHTNPSDFMSLVQRLTGCSSSSCTAAADIPPSSPSCHSPAARIATFERADDGERPRKSTGLDEFDQLAIHDVETLDRPSLHPGILSPVPSSLPSVSPNFFSNSADPNTLSFLHEQSPAFHGNRSFVDNTFLVSPNNFLSSPVVPSPSSYWDLFNQYNDF